MEAAIDRIALDPGGGYLIYMAGHEGRGIGLWAKASWGHRLSPEDIN
jgi:GTP cyclohydrolase II